MKINQEDMISPYGVEKALFRWPPYLDALFAFRRRVNFPVKGNKLEDWIQNVQPDMLLSAAYEELKSLALHEVDLTRDIYVTLGLGGREFVETIDCPKVLPLDLYFICCAFSFEDCWTGKAFNLERIRIPRWLAGVNKLGPRVYPPPILSRKDFPMGGSLPDEHPIWSIARRRGQLPCRQFVDPIAKECSRLRDCDGLSEAEIGRRFKWRLQQDEYGRKQQRCVTAKRYIARGRNLLKADDITSIREDPPGLR